MDAKKDCEDQGNSEARIVEITEGAQIFIASISDILKKVQKALSDKHCRIRRIGRRLIIFVWYGGCCFGVLGHLVRIFLAGAHRCLFMRCWVSWMMY